MDSGGALWRAATTIADVSPARGGPPPANDEKHGRSLERTAAPVLCVDPRFRAWPQTASSHRPHQSACEITCQPSHCRRGLWLAGPRALYIITRVAANARARTATIARARTPKHCTPLLLSMRWATPTATLPHRTDIPAVSGGLGRGRDTAAIGPAGVTRSAQAPVPARRRRQV